MKKKTKRQQAISNRRAGRTNEKAIADLLGMELKGLYGGEDAKDSKYSAEIKKRKGFVGKGWMEQAVKNCPEGKVPIVVVHVTGQKRLDDIVMVRLKNWRKVCGLES